MENELLSKEQSKYIDSQVKLYHAILKKIAERDMIVIGTTADQAIQIANAIYQGYVISDALEDGTYNLNETVKYYLEG
ncbi:hypothetical protein AB3331_04715 [Streptococcus sp. H49]|uniref:hypothetical protein n=1 Tax=Streptococcus huangxiaojuni TaxID=3237239 RepID=UPI0034A31FE1